MHAVTTHTQFISGPLKLQLQLLSRQGRAPWTVIHARTHTHTHAYTPSEAHACACDLCRVSSKACAVNPVLNPDAASVLKPDSASTSQPEGMLHTGLYAQPLLEPHLQMEHGLTWRASRWYPARLRWTAMHAMGELASAAKSFHFKSMHTHIHPCKRERRGYMGP